MKKIKTGFSMVELLFVMAVMAALAAIAIPSMSASKDSAILTSMKSDTRNAISAMQAAYVDEQDYTSIAAADTAYTDTNDNGKTQELVTDGIKLSVSDGNTITFTTVSADKFVVEVSNGTLTGKKIVFDTETGKIKTTSSNGSD